MTSRRDEVQRQTHASTHARVKSEPSSLALDSYLKLHAADQSDSLPPSPSSFSGPCLSGDTLLDAQRKTRAAAPATDVTSEVQEQ